MTEKLQRVGRLAMRREGQLWNAYFADDKTMDGAIHIGSIKMSIVEHDKEIKAAFMNLMCKALGAVFKDAIGRSPEWKEPEPAPEHERAGHG